MLLVFIEEDPSAASLRQREVVESVAALSTKLEVTVLNPRDRRRETVQYGVEMFPRTVRVDDNDFGIRFVALTGGHEFTAFGAGVRQDFAD